MRIIIKLTLIYLFVFMLGSCSQKSNPLVGEWEMEWSFVNGVQDSEEIKISLKLFEDGLFWQEKQSFGSKQVLKGKWFFNEKDNVFEFFYQVNRTRVKWNVKTLDVNTLEMTHEIPGFFVERRFMRKVD